MKKFVALLLVLTLSLGLLLAGCHPKILDAPATPAPSAEATPTAAPAPSAEPSNEPNDGPVPPPPIPVNLALLAGPTGVGAAKLMADTEHGHDPSIYAYNSYNITVESDNSAVTTKLANGEYDIAALATNVASTLYHKTNGKVQIAAINTLGVLYILSNGQGDPLNTLADLRGRTLYAFGQGANPEYVLNYLLGQNGVDPAEVDIQWKGAAAEVSTAFTAAEGPALCMLPVPAATALAAKGAQVAFDLSAEWDFLQNGSQLTMGCVVVRTEFAQQHPDAVAHFLEEYKDSIEYVRENPAEAAEWIAEFGIAPSAPIAQKAIPQCNLVCYTGYDMRDAIQGYYEILYAADPKSIGGSIPDDGFYFMGE